MTKKTNVEDIIGLVQTDEPTNSVQLKKEAQLSICEKRIIELRKENEQLKSEIKDLNDVLASREEVYLKPVIAMIDDRITHYKHKPFSAPISNPANPNYDADVDRIARLTELQNLRKEIME